MQLLGVRHHGPGSARSVRVALDQHEPAAVLVELPSDTEPVLAWATDPEMVPPVALLGHVVDQPERAAFLPLAEFSPEWQALRWAAGRGVPVIAIDLPLRNTMAGSLDDATTAPPDGGAPPITAADALGAIAAAAGDPDPERWWEDLVEHRGDGEPAFAAIAELVEAARAGTATSSLDAVREAHMRRSIRAAARDHGRVSVVCGAWHVPAIDPDRYPASGDVAALRGLRRVKVAVTWVPWTHKRLAASSGYGAGVPHPGWYHHVFRHPGASGIVRFFVDAARRSRAAGSDVSPDHLIAASRLAGALAVLRERPRPGLAEVLDAADAVLGELPLVQRELVVGDAIGEVPVAAPQVPLARDLAVQQRLTRLKPSPAVRTVEVDLRAPLGLARSRLLHRLLALGVPWGSLREGRRSSGTFRETWQVAWEPELSVRLVELAGHGTTVATAATSRLVERAAGTDRIGDVVDSLATALLADLPDAVGPCVATLQDRAVHDPDVGHLVDALLPLGQALQYGDVRGTDTAALRTVFDGIVARVLVGLVAACSSLDTDAAEVMVERLAGLQGALAVVDHPARHRRLPDVLGLLATGAGHGLVQGRATRLLHDAGAWGPADVHRRFSLALSPGTPAASGASFVEGFLAGSGTVLLHDAELRDVIDLWLSSLAADAFTATVPLLRRTFGAFEPAERRQLGWLISGAAPPAPAGFGPEVDERRAEAALVTVRHLLGLPVPDGDGDHG